jgi:hypothetical protein
MVRPGDNPKLIGPKGRSFGIPCDPVCGKLSDLFDTKYFGLV